MVNHLNQNLKFLMSKENLTSLDLAEHIGTSEVAINKLKTGSLTNPTLNTILGIANYFNVPLDKLVPTQLG